MLNVALPDQLLHVGPPHKMLAALHQFDRAILRDNLAVILQAPHLRRPLGEQHKHKNASVESGNR
jgi:hypothetical protein